MSQRTYRRRDMLQLPALGATGVAGAFLIASPVRAAGSNRAACGELMDYDPALLPKNIDQVDAFFEPGRYVYEWRGSPSERYPNGNMETGHTTVRTGDAGEGIAYEIVAEIKHLDRDEREVLSKRWSITNVIPALDESIVFLTHSSFGSHHRGVVTELNEERLVVSSYGLSDHRRTSLFSRWLFDRRGRDYRVDVFVRGQPEDDWSLIGESSWRRTTALR